METAKNMICGVLGLAAAAFYIAFSCMLGVLPIIIGFWLWQKLLG